MFGVAWPACKIHIIIYTHKYTRSRHSRELGYFYILLYFTPSEPIYLLGYDVSICRPVTVNIYCYSKRIKTQYFLLVFGFGATPHRIDMSYRKTNQNICTDLHAYVRPFLFECQSFTKTAKCSKQQDESICCEPFARFDHFFVEWSKKIMTKMWYMKAKIAVVYICIIYCVFIMLSSMNWCTYIA